VEVAKAFRILYLSVLALSLAVLFQNFSGCQESIRFGSNLPSNQRASGGGGEPSDGKPQNYYRWIQGYRCKGKPTVVGEIHRQGSLINAKILNLDTCELEPQPIALNQTSTSNLNPDVLGFNGGIYVYNPSLSGPLSELGDPFELWCRSEEKDKIELLIKPSPLGPHSVEILSQGLARIGPIQLQRRLLAEEAVYSGTNLQLAVARISSITSNEVSGSLKMTGIVENAKLRCRFGSDLDSFNHFAPARQLDFFGPTLPVGVSLNRSSTGTYVNSNGLIQTAAADSPRFDFDVVRGLSKGLLSERSSTNLLARSSELERWTQMFVNVTPNTDETADPSGQQTAELVRNNTTLEVHQILTTVVLQPNRFHTLSAFIKPANTNPVRYLRLQVLDLATNATIWVNFDILNATVAVNNDEFTSRNVMANVERVGSGWLRVSMSGLLVGPSTSWQVFFEPVPGEPSNGIYADPLQSGYYIWGAQLEQSESMSSYIPTTAGPVTRATDIVTVDDLSWWDEAASEMSLMLEKQLPLASASPRDASFASDLLLNLDSLGSNLLNIGFDRTTAQVTSSLATGQTATVLIPNLLGSPGDFVVLRPVVTYSGLGVLSVTSNGFNTEVSGGAGPLSRPSVLQLHSDSIGPASTHLQTLRYWPFKLNDNDRIDLSGQQQPQ
jgi:hypothetical protein